MSALVLTSSITLHRLVSGDGIENEDFAESVSVEAPIFDLFPTSFAETRPSPLMEPTEVTTEEGPPQFDREMILSDHEGRISETFAIPDGLRDRVGFWFDIYTKYDEHNRVVHHQLYPWIVFKVVDVTPIIFSDSPRFRWMRNEKADKHVNVEADRIRAALRSLAKRRDGVPKTDDERAVAEALAPLGGNLRRQAQRAAAEVRVQTGQRNFFVEGLHISHTLLPKMEQIFIDHKLPIELTRLPFVESSFKDHATSKIGASGIWQFTATTGKHFMRVDDLVDERRSPLKATVGAARLLKENHMILGRSWPLALSAWNHGPGGIRKAAKAAGSKDLVEIIAKYRSRSFDFASSNFYAGFLAALHAERYELEIFGDLEKEERPALHEFQVPRQIRIADLVRSSGLTMAEFLALNPDLKQAARRNIALPRGFILHVPETTKLELEKLFASTSPSSRKRAS